MSWYKETDRYPSWDSWTKINYNIEERFGGKFIVENSTQGCTLIVTNVQKTDYKYFRCTYPNYSHGFAKLVVIGKLVSYFSYAFAAVGLIFYHKSRCLWFRPSLEWLTIR